MISRASLMTVASGIGDAMAPCEQLRHSDDSTDGHTCHEDGGPVPLQSTQTGTP
jgi:hypothetical protein